MPYLNLDLDYFNHPKTVRLVGLLGRGSEALPIRLWCYCGKYHMESGKLADYSPQEIESLVGWWGKPGEMVEVMEKVGLLEKLEKGYKVRDWGHYQGHLHALKVRNKKVALNRWKNMKKASKSNNYRRHQKSTSGIPLNECGVPLPIPYHTIPKRTTDTDAAKAASPGHQETGKEEKQYPIDTPLRRVVCGWKVVTGYAKDDRVWDKAHWPRVSKSAKVLLDFIGDPGDTIDCMEQIYGEMTKRGLSCTIETIVKHSAEWRTKHGNKVIA